MHVGRVGHDTLNNIIIIATVKAQACESDSFVIALINKRTTEQKVRCIQVL